MASFRWLPTSAPQHISGFTEQLSFRLLWRYRKRMHETLEQTMGNEFCTEVERQAIARQAWRNIIQGALETITTLYLPKDELCSQIKVIGEERLREALARKKGVIALSAHFGVFGMIGPRLAAQGYEFSAVAKLAGETRLAKLQNEYGARAGVKIIPARPRRESVLQVITALRRNKIVLLIPDEFKSPGVSVDFLGHRVSAPRSPITIARRTGAAVLPIFMVRNHHNQLTLNIEPAINFVETGNKKADLRTNARLFVQEIENMVRRYPEQWSWMGLRDNRKSDGSRAIS